MANLKELCRVLDSVDTVNKRTRAGRSILSKSALRRRLKDELETTSTTEEAVAVAVDALATAPAEEVVEATVQILGGVIERLSGDTVTDLVDEGSEDPEYDSTAGEDAAVEGLPSDIQDSIR